MWTYVNFNSSDTFSCCTVKALGAEHIKITIEDVFYNTCNSLILLYSLHMLLQIWDQVIFITYCIN